MTVDVFGLRIDRQRWRPIWAMRRIGKERAWRAPLREWGRDTGGMGFM